MDFFDFFPGLSRSNEAYFGHEAPLAQTLITGSEKLINFAKTAKTDSKTFYSQIIKLTTELGANIARDINAEACHIMILPNKNINASAFNMMTLADTCYKYEQDGRSYIGVDFDKVADLEDIIVGTDGYKFKNKKGKILFLTLNYGLLINEEQTPEQMAGVICHEIGHCFQQGIYGLYKNIADICIANTVKLKKEQVGKIDPPGPISWLLNKSFAGKLFFALVSYLWVFNGNLFTSGIMSKFGAWLERTFWGDKAKDTTFKLKDKLKTIDKDEESAEAQHAINEIYRTGSAYSIQNIIVSQSKQWNNVEKTKWIKAVNEENKKKWDEYNKQVKPDTEAKKSLGFYLFHFFRCINLDFWLLSENIVEVLSLNSYTVKQYSKISFYKKYEFFADVFATSYGFGADLWKVNMKTEIDVNKSIDDYWIFGLNKVPFFKALFKTQSLIYELKNEKIDEHGTGRERAINTYTALMQELKTNPSLTGDQKKEIQADIQRIIDADEAFYQEEKENGFWFKYYNKLIDKRIKGEQSEDTIEQVLKPIQELCNENPQKIK